MKIMKKHYTFLLILSLLIFSCSENMEEFRPEVSEKEVEIQISHSAQGKTRASVPDPGTSDERRIDELDLLVFDNSGYFLYTREAYKLDETKYRATMKESPASVTVQLLANCRTKINLYKNSWNTSTEWSTIQQQLIDTDPGRLVGKTTFQPLPMWGTFSGTISTTQVNKWGPIQMLRSVASVDLRVEKNTKTADFELVSLHLYYAPDKGYLPALNGTGTPKQYDVPADMATNLHSLVADNVFDLTVNPDQSNEKKYAAITNQMYLYDNNVSADDIKNGTTSNRFTRVIMEGYYKQADKSEEDKKSSFYPIDFVYSDGSFRPIIRNWKYEFNVTGVHGPGYEKIEEAAENYPVDLNVEVINWNTEEVEIGSEGRYYVAVQRKKSILDRKAQSTDKIQIIYRIEDLVPGNEFKLAFKDTITNGTPSDIANGIKNKYFQVELLHDTSGGKADLVITALQNYTAGHDKETVILKFRNLQFEIVINQLDWTDVDWNDGGDKETDV